MEVKALIDCNGIGYENLEAGESREVSEEVGALLVSFGYAESEEPEPTPEPTPEPDIEPTAEPEPTPAPKKSKKETAED